MCSKLVMYIHTGVYCISMCYHPYTTASQHSTFFACLVFLPVWSMCTFGRFLDVLIFPGDSAKRTMSIFF